MAACFDLTSRRALFRAPTSRRTKAVVQLTREQMISVGALGLVFLVCAFAAIMSLQARFGANHELAERRNALSQLEARARSAPLTQAKTTTTAAPAAAFLDAPTAGLAAAQLQAYL